MRSGQGRTGERKKLRFGLLENGIDFVRSGVEHYFLRDTPKPRDHKYAVLHIFAGVLLLMKERLHRAHPSLIFKRVEDSAKDVTREDIRTIGFDEAVARLKACADVEIPNPHLSTLRSLQRIRNQLEHHSVSLDLRQTQSIVGGLCEFVYIFMKEQLNEDLSDHPEPPVWERVQELRGIAKRLEEERELEWRNRAGKYFGLSVADLDMLKASIEPYHPKHNPDPAQLYSCPECAAESVVITEDSDIGVCTNSECREVFEVTECTRCYRPVVPDRMFCEECQGYLDSQ